MLLYSANGNLNNNVSNIFQNAITKLNNLSNIQSLILLHLANRNLRKKVGNIFENLAINYHAKIFLQFLIYFCIQGMVNLMAKAVWRKFRKLDGKIRRQICFFNIRILMLLKFWKWKRQSLDIFENVATEYNL